MRVSEKSVKHDAPKCDGPRVSREGAKGPKRNPDRFSSSCLRAFVPSCETLEQLPRTATDFRNAHTESDTLYAAAEFILSTSCSSCPPLPSSQIDRSRRQTYDLEPLEFSVLLNLRCVCVCVCVRCANYRTSSASRSRHPSPTQLLFPEGDKHHSPGSRPQVAHPGLRPPSEPTLKGLYIVSGPTPPRVEPFPGSFHCGSLTQGARPKRRDPGL